MTNGYYGQFYDKYVFPRAVGVSPDKEVNCYYLVDGLVAALTVNAQNDATGVYLTEFDQQGFEQDYQEAPNPLYVTTTIEELTNVYLGKNIQDY